MEGFVPVFLDVLPKLIPGAGTTLLLTVCGVGCGIIIGLLMALMKMGKNRVLRFIANVYIETLRGTPLYVQIFLWHFGVASIIGDLFFGGKFSFPLLVTGVVVLSLNSGAYVAEIFRAGIQGVDKGQLEAARSLGMSHREAMRHVILPQAFKLVIPPLGNQFINLVKNSSVLAFVAGFDLMYQGNLIANDTLATMPTYFIVGIMYLIITLPLSYYMRHLEKKLA